MPPTTTAPPATLPIGSLPVGVLLPAWPPRRLCCAACGQSVPGRGCRRYGAATFCPTCSGAYLQAWASGQYLRPDQYLAATR